MNVVKELLAEICHMSVVAQFNSPHHKCNVKNVQ